MLVVEVDVVGLQAAERAFHGTAYRLRARVGQQRIRHDAAFHVEAQAEFRGNGNPVTVGSQGFAQQFLVVVRTLIDIRIVGGVKECVTHVHSFSQEFRHLPMVGRRTVGMAHAIQPSPTAETRSPLFPKFLYSIV